MINQIFSMALSLVLGGAAGTFLALSMAGPAQGGKAAPLYRRLWPLPLCLLLMILSFFSPLSPKGRLIALTFLPIFAFALTGTAIGLGRRDEKLLEMASVFRVPPLSRMRFIDLPACKGATILSLCLGAAASLLLGLFTKGGALS